MGTTVDTSVGTKAGMSVGRTGVGSGRKGGKGGRPCKIAETTAAGGPIDGRGRPGMGNGSSVGRSPVGSAASALAKGPPGPKGSGGKPEAAAEPEAVAGRVPVSAGHRNGLSQGLNHGAALG